VETISRAIESVISQRYPSVEHIIIDGGSTDGTLEVLARYPQLRIVSEPDRNLYDAINKGLRLASGDVVGLLNSDDLYAPGAFDAVASGFADPNIQMITGGAEIFELKDNRETVLRRFTNPRAIGVNEANAIGNVTLINSSFWRRSFLQKFNLFDDRFSLASDKDFWMRLAIEQPPHVLLSQVLYRYLSHGGSLTFSGADIRETVSTHLLTLARTRVSECRAGTPEHAAYRRWHAWAVGYRVLVLFTHRHLGDALRTVREGCAVDPIWLVRFLRRLPSHWKDRDLRRGRP
jgi:glycosyltransferase involved in cell wall biosynthesis